LEDIRVMFNIMTNQNNRNSIFSLNDIDEISPLVNSDDWNNLKNFLNANSLDDVEVNNEVFH